MTTTLQKYPIPNPSTGVMRGTHPRELGFNGFSYAKNWVRRGGVFQTRDGLTEYPIVFAAPLDLTNEKIMGLFQYDYQKDGEYTDGVNDTKDSLVAVTDASLYWLPMDVDVTEWDEAAIDVADYGTITVGPNVVTGVAFAPATKVEFTWDTIDWGAISTWIAAGGASNILWISVDFEAYSTGYRYRITDNEGNTQVSSEAGYGTSFPHSAELSTFGITATWQTEDFDDEILQYNWGGPPYYARYRCRIWQGAEQVASEVIGGSRDSFEIMRAWDYGQETHVLVASPEHCISDFTMTSGELTVAGGVASAPKARTLSVAGQRIVAGNVRFLDHISVIENRDPDEDYTDDDWVAYPDGVIYSGTVLESGHERWYQEYLFRLADTPGEIVASLEMGTMMDAIYKTDAIYVLAVQSGTEPFRPDLRASGIQGPVSSLAVCAISDNLHVFLGRDGALYFFDGSAPRSMGPHIQDWLTADLDNDYAHRSFLVYDNEARELKVWYPAKGHEGRVRCGITISFDDQAQPVWPFEYDTGTTLSGTPPVPTHSKNWDMTCALDIYIDRSAVPGDMLSFSGSGHTALGNLVLREKALFVCNSGSATEFPEIFYENPGAYDVTIPIKASFLTGATDFESLDRMKVVTELELLCDQLGYGAGVPARDSLEITLWSGNQNTYLTQAEIQMVDLTASPPYFAEFRTEGRFFAIGAEIQATRKTTFGGALAAFRVLGRPR